MVFVLCIIVISWAMKNLLLENVEYKMGEYVWSMNRADPEAVSFFNAFLARFIS